MKAIVYHRYGSPDVLSLADVPKPRPKAGEILVRIHAASLNALDWHSVRGKPYVARLSMGLRKPKRHFVGVDLAGTVEAVGTGVTEFTPGDEVFANKGRGSAECVAGKASLFSPRPKNLTMEQAAAVPAAGITALQAVRDRGSVKPGQKVLIHGAGGGVGTFSVQIAKALGAEVTGVTRTENLDMVRTLGADHVIDYTREDFTRGANRYDVIIDNGATRTLVSMKRVLTPSGIIVGVGASKGDWIGPLVRIFGGGLLAKFGEQRIVGFICDPTREDHMTMKELIEAGKVTPCVDRVYPLAETPEAMRYLETLNARGKIVIGVAS